MEPTGSRNELAKGGIRLALWERGSWPVLSLSPDTSWLFSLEDKLNHSVLTSDANFWDLFLRDLVRKK